MSLSQELCYCVVLVRRPANWLPASRLDCPPLVTVLGAVVPQTELAKARLVAKCYNRHPEPGRWAAVKAIPRPPSRGRP